MSSLAGQPEPDRRVSQYEFDQKEGEICRSLGGAISFVGAGWLVLGIFEGIIVTVRLVYANNDVFEWSLGMGQAIAMFLIGVWFRGAGHAFGEIARTKGNDMGNLMQALLRLRSAFLLQRAALVLMIALVLLGIAFALFALAVSPA